MSLPRAVGRDVRGELAEAAGRLARARELMDGLAAARRRQRAMLN